ncbi:MAG: hypothetical protein EA377_03205 [Phycisphaerales bacterium]|nr:MAG: hypothetical protein EA377_03205 [Phycisphaerales bacterium]
MVFLFIGATINILVAWSCALWMDHVASPKFAHIVAPFSPDNQIGFRRLLSVSDRPGLRIIHSTHYVRLRSHNDDPQQNLQSSVVEIDDVAFRRMVTKETYRLLSRQTNFRDGRLFEREIQAGLPLRSMVRVDPQPPDEGFLAGLFAPNQQATTRTERCKAGAAHIVAFSPIWPAFLVNSLVYALLSCLIYLASVRCIMMWRQRRGRCVKCKYDLRGHAHRQCPECGFVLKGMASPADAAQSGKPR